MWEIFEVFVVICGFVEFVVLDYCVYCVVED